MPNIHRITKTQWLIAALLLCQIHLLGGCDDDEDDEAADSKNGETGETGEWTNYTSEEVPPLQCPGTEAARGLDCHGGFCDDVSLYCSETNHPVGKQSWLPYFSEDWFDSPGKSKCPDDDMWISGIACSGPFCDNLSLLCTQFVGTSTGACKWSGWHSEEEAPFVAPLGYYFKGVECDGWFCDDMRYRYCFMY